MKLIKRLFILTSLLLTISIIIQSCCEETYKIIGDGEIGAYEDYYNSLNLIDTIKGEFLIHWQLDLKVTSAHNSLGIVQSCYATSCAETFENEIIDSTFTIKCNKDFEYDNENIVAGTNFSEIETLVINTVGNWGAVQVEFSNDFMNLTNFENGDYEFYVNIMTTDKVEFENQLKTYINIQ